MGRPVRGQNSEKGGRGQGGAATGWAGCTRRGRRPRSGCAIWSPRTPRACPGTRSRLRAAPALWHRGAGCPPRPTTTRAAARPRPGVARAATADAHAHHGIRRQSWRTAAQRTITSRAQRHGRMLPRVPGRADVCFPGPRKPSLSTRKCSTNLGTYREASCLCGAALRGRVCA